MLLIGWLTLFDKRIGVPDTGDWFEEPPNKEDEEELVPIFRTTSETRKITNIVKFNFLDQIEESVDFRYSFWKERGFDHFLGWSYVNIIFKQ